MTEQLHHKFAVLQQNLLHGKLPRALAWQDALDLITHLGKVESHAGEEMTFIVGEERALFSRPRSGEMEIDEVSRLRRFLKSAGSGAGVSKPTSMYRMIVVIDHHDAHIYRDVGGSRPQAVDSLRPLDPHHFHHHLVHKKEAHYQGDRVPEDKVFFADVAKALTPADEIIMIGHGVGKSNVTVALLDYLKTHAPEAAARVAAVEVADLSALTEPQIEQIARRHMTSDSSGNLAAERQP
jgi:hypothetical protein